MKTLLLIALSTTFWGLTAFADGCRLADNLAGVWSSDNTLLPNLEFILHKKRDGKYVFTAHKLIKKSIWDAPVRQAYVLPMELDFEETPTDDEGLLPENRVESVCLSESITAAIYNDSRLVAQVTVSFRNERTPRAFFSIYNYQLPRSDQYSLWELEKGGYEN